MIDWADDQIQSGTGAISLDPIPDVAAPVPVPVPRKLADRLGTGSLHPRYVGAGVGVRRLKTGDTITWELERAASRWCCHHYWSGEHERWRPVVRTVVPPGAQAQAHYSAFRLCE